MILFRTSDEKKKRKEAHYVQGNKVGLTTDFLQEIMQAWRQRSNIFKLLKGKKYCQDRTPFPAKLFYKQRGNKYFCRLIKAGKLSSPENLCYNKCYRKPFKQEKSYQIEIWICSKEWSLVSGTYRGKYQ